MVLAAGLDREGAQKRAAAARPICAAGLSSASSERSAESLGGFGQERARTDS